VTKNADDALGDIARTGHFAYESGDHGDTWLALDLLLADPRRLRNAATRLAEHLESFAPEVVCGPLTGGAFVGLLVADALGARFVPAARRADPGGPVRYDLPPSLRPLLAGARVAVVDDAVNAGSAALASAAAVEAAGGEVVAVGALYAREPGAAELLAKRGLPLVALSGLPFALWTPAACPLCAAGIPLDATD
jgi:orotate phosphoribosyltransferase